MMQSNSGAKCQRICAKIGLKIAKPSEKRDINFMFLSQFDKKKNIQILLAFLCMSLRTKYYQKIVIAQKDLPEKVCMLFV